MIDFPNNPVIDEIFTDANSVIWICTMAVSNGDPDNAWARVGVSDIPAPPEPA